MCGFQTSFQFDAASPDLGFLSILNPGPLPEWWMHAQGAELTVRADSYLIDAMLDMPY